jgi:uncharacterized phage protein (TIGR01671 family)
MRDIEFRGKRLDNGEWVYGNLIVNRDYAVSEKQNGDVDIELKSVRTKITTIHFSADIEPEAVGQYAGLEDKNGMKIFEGDIVNSTATGDDENAGEKYGVVFENLAFMIRRGKTCYMLCNYDSEDLEVIGNIHDNSELLKEASDG